MKRIASAFLGSGLKARALRGGSWLTLGHAAGQAMRLASNLILARLLFPEAFGLAALVSVIVIGLAMFSDVGLGPAVMQNKRGDDPDFLDTVWTVQVIRGVLLFALACLAAKPIGAFYDEPELARYLPLAAVSLLLAGFNPTRIETAHRHMLVGRMTALELLSQFISLVVMLVLAYVTRSVFALVIGTVIQAGAKLLLTHFLLAGHRNRFCWDRAAVTDIMGFGKWIFLSTALGFVISQSDRAILGKYLSLEALGLYNIGYFLGSFPVAMGLAVCQKLMIAIYRDTPPESHRENWRKLRLMRSAITIGLLTLLLGLAAFGPALVGILYDDRYLLSGPIVTLVAVAMIPNTICLTYDSAALAAGDSLSFFLLSLTKAAALIAAILLGITFYGLIGTILALGVGMLAAYPMVVWLSVRHHVWDPLHDVCAALIGGGLAACVLWINRDQIALLAAY